MSKAIHFKRDQLPFIPCRPPGGGETTIARVINAGSASIWAAASRSWRAFPSTGR